MIGKFPLVISVLIDYGKEWQNAWDEHVKNWKPTSPENDYNNLTIWTDPSETSSGDAGYVRAEVFNNDDEAPIRTVEEQKTNPYPHSVEIMCHVNVGHKSPYYFVPLTIPFFIREWNEARDMDPEAETLEKCNVTARFPKADVIDDDDDDDDDIAGSVNEDSHGYLYTIEMDVKKHQDSWVIYESHVIRNVPWKAILFRNIEYTSDVFLKQAFRHEMRLPDELFPKAWMNLS